jgi:anti-sigma B factor antagonist
MNKLIITERQSGSVTILDIKGKVTMGENSTVFRSAIRRLLGENKMNILLNVADLDYVDSSGLGELVSGFTAVSREGGSLKLVNLMKHFQDILSITKLLTVFDSFEDEDEALKSFGKGEYYEKQA